MKRTLYIWLCISVITLFALLNLMLGTKNYALLDIYYAIIQHSSKAIQYAILQVRLPKVLGAIAIGGILGLCGYIFQTLLHNPLASPDMIGITSSTSTVAVVCILFFGIRNGWLYLISFLAGLLITYILYRLSFVGKTFRYQRMIIIGIALQALLRAIVNYVISKAAPYDIPTALQWLNGSLNHMTLSKIPLLLLTLIFGTLILLFYQKDLEVLPLGEQLSQTIGVEISKVTLILIFTSVMLLTIASSTVGPIASVSFLSPMIARQIFKEGKSCLIPSLLVGMALTLISEFIASHLFTTIYPVGIITGLLGAPYFIYRLIVENRKEKHHAI